MSPAHINPVIFAFPSFAVNVQDYLKNVLEPHEQRLRATYDWQEQFAQALFDLVDQIEQTERNIQAGFDGTSAPATTPTRRPGGPGGPTTL